MLLCGLIDKDLRRICRSQYEHLGSVGERSNFKKFLRTRKIMVMHSNERGSMIYIPSRSTTEAFGWCSRTFSRSTDPSTESTTPPWYAHVWLSDVPRTHDPAECQGRVLLARRHDDNDDDEATDAGLRLSTATILSRCNMVEGGTAHG